MSHLMQSTMLKVLNNRPDPTAKFGNNKGGAMEIKCSGNRLRYAAPNIGSHKMHCCNIKWSWIKI